MDGLLRGLDINNVVSEKRQRNNSDSSQSIPELIFLIVHFSQTNTKDPKKFKFQSFHIFLKANCFFFENKQQLVEVIQKKKTAQNQNDLNPVRKQRKTSTENGTIKEVRKNSDSQEDDQNIQDEEDEKISNSPNNSQQIENEHRNQRSSVMQVIEEFPVSKKKKLKLDAKLTQQDDKKNQQQVQQELSAMNQNNTSNMNEEGQSPTSNSQDLQKKTRNKQNTEIENIRLIQKSNFAQNIKKQVDNEPNSFYENKQKKILVNKNQNHSETNIKLDLKQQQQPISLLKGHISDLSLQGVASRKKSKSEDSIKQDFLEESENQKVIYNKKLHKREVIPNDLTEAIQLNERDQRASKRNEIKKIQIEELIQCEKQSNGENQEMNGQKTLNLQNDKHEENKDKTQTTATSKDTSKTNKQVSFSEKLSEIIGEDNNQDQIINSKNNNIDCNGSNDDSDSEKNYFPSREAQKKHNKQRRTKKKQQALEIKNKKKLQEIKKSQTKTFRTIITVELPSISSDDDEEAQISAFAQKLLSKNKNSKTEKFQNKDKDLDQVRSYLQQKEKNETNQKTIEREGTIPEIVKEQGKNQNSKKSQNNKNSNGFQANNNKQKKNMGNSDQNVGNNQIFEKENANLNNQKDNQEENENSNQIVNDKKRQQHITSTKIVKNKIEIKSEEKEKKQSYPINLQIQMHEKDNNLKKYQYQNNLKEEKMQQDQMIDEDTEEQDEDNLKQSAYLQKEKASPCLSYNSKCENQQEKSLDIQNSLLSQIIYINKNSNSLIFNDRQSAQIEDNKYSSFQNSENNSMIEEELKESQSICQEFKSSQKQKDNVQNQISNFAAQEKEVEVEKIQTNKSRVNGENRKIDINNPNFYDSKIDFINSNIFFKNYFTLYQPLERTQYYQNIAYQHHITHTQNTTNTNIQNTNGQHLQTINSDFENQSENNTDKQQLENSQQYPNKTKQLNLESEEVNNQIKNASDSKTLSSCNEFLKNTKQTPLKQPNSLNEDIDLQTQQEDISAQIQKQQESKQLTYNQQYQQNNKQQQHQQNSQQNIDQSEQKIELDDQNKEQQRKKKIGVKTNKSKESIDNMIELQQHLDLLYAKYHPSQTYINCDLRYFNLELIIQNTGQFDIVYMDPPWRIKGGQQFDSKFMFSNSKFSLEYNTMSNLEIMDIPVEKLSSKGFLFLWVLNTSMDTAVEMMQKWGYNLVDKIVWVKMKDKNVYLSHGYYFMHSYEVCLIGYKNQKDEVSELYPASVYFNMIDEKNLDENKIKQTNKRNELIKSDYPQFFNKISNNVIFAEVRKKSQKPDEFYEIMDMIIPGGKKVELFARNNNLRPGWVSVGNQLGETYEKWTHSVDCDNCNQEITKGKFKRYKSRRINNYDICENCVEKFDRKDFYEIQNKVNEDVLHNYQSCNRCEAEPIWGIRFHCTVCKDYDLCEACVDENTKLEEGEQFHELVHDMKIIEVPVFADGFPVHDRKCQSCFQSPIIGTCFTCKQCSGNFNLCQNCFFNKPMEQIKNKRHKPEHQMDALISPIKSQRSKKNLYKCSGCGIINLTDMYKCESCHGFYFCIKCYDTKRDDFKTYMASTHKNYHSLIRYNLLEIEEQEAENKLKALQQNQTISQQIEDKQGINIFIKLNHNKTFFIKQTDNNQDKQSILEQNESSLNNHKYHINNSDDSLKQNISNKNKSKNNNQNVNNQDDENDKMELEQDEEDKNKLSVKLNKNGKPKRQYNKKQKKEISTENIQIKNSQVEDEEDNTEQDQSKNVNGLDLIQKILESNLFYSNKKESSDKNQKIKDEQENNQNDIQEEDDQNSKKESAPIVKKIRKKRESKKMKKNNDTKKQTEELIELDKQDQEDKIYLSDQDENKEGEKDQDVEQNDQEQENSVDQGQENQEQKKKRKRRTKEEIEKDNEEKEKRYQQYLKNVENGTEKKKRGRVSKKLTMNQQLNTQIENEEFEKREEDSDEDVSQNKEEQIISFQSQQAEYLDKLMIDEAAIKNIDADSNHIKLTYGQIFS